MATITETSPAMSDVQVATGVRISFVVIDHDDRRAVAVADGNGRTDPNLRDRVFVETQLRAERSDGRGVTYRETTAQHVDATNYTGLSVSTLLAGLKIIHDVDRDREGLA